MDFAFSEDQLAIKDNVAKLCAQFDDKYWLKKDKEGGFPEDFYQAMADAGWLGIAMPEAYGGAGLGITEAALVMQTVAESGAALQGASAIHLNVFGPNPIVVFGTEEQKQRILPDIIAGKVKGCFAVTEPDAGLNTTALETRAERQGNGYVVHGKKTWTTTAQVADKMLLIARTTPKDKCKRSTDGLSLFYTDFDRSKIEVREIEKMGRKAVDTNQIFIDGLKVPLEDRIGEEGKGFHYLLHGLNPERGRGDRHRQGGPRPRHAICQGAHRVRPADRQEPGDPASAGRELDAARGRQSPDLQGGLALRQRQGMRRGSQLGQVSRRADGLRGLRARHPDPRRLRLRQGIPCRALPARGHDRPHRAGQRAAHPVLCGRAGAGPAQELLGISGLSPAPAPDGSRALKKDSVRGRELHPVLVEKTPKNRAQPCPTAWRSICTRNWRNLEVLP